jgi:hypothetical protein
MHQRVIGRSYLTVRRGKSEETTKMAKEEKKVEKEK